MIDNTPGNVVLTKDQLSSIEIAKTRLSNIEAEVGIAKGTLFATKGEIENAVKARKYEEERLEAVKKNLQDKEVEFASLTASAEAAKKLLEETKVETAEKIESLQKKESELTIREAAVLKDEEKVETEAKSIRSEAATIAEEKKVLEDAKKAFEEAVKTISWKSSKE